MPIRPFGYEADRHTIRPDEAEHLRRAAERIIAGDTLTGIVRDWNTHGVTTTAGNQWQPGVLRRALRSERVIGKRRTPEGTLIDGGWEPILDADVHAQVAAKFDETGSAAPAPTTTRTYLLTGGIAICGLCTKPLIAKSAVAGKRAYACSSGGSTHGCGKIRVKGELLDDEVGLRVMAKFRPKDSRARLVRLIKAVETSAGDVDIVLKQAKQRLAELGEEYAKGRVAGETLRSATAALKAEMAGARDLRRTAEALQAIAVDQDTDLPLWWEGASLAQQRTLLEVVVHDVAVMPPPVKGSTVFAPERVKIRWK